MTVGCVRSASLHDSFDAAGKNGSVSTSTLDEGGRCDDARKCIARRRFEQWRTFRGGCGRIPHELWMAAAEAAAEHGAEAVAADLDADLGRLRHWMRSVDGGEPERAAAAFVELPPLAGFAGIADAVSAAECTLEFEEPSGRKLRISLRGPAMRRFWNSAGCFGGPRRDFHQSYVADLRSDRAGRFSKGHRRPSRLVPRAA
jgi:hypothetical protein